MTASNDNEAFVPDWPGRIVGNAGHDQICAVLVFDVQAVPDWAGQVLAKVEDVISGKSTGWEMAMNAHILNVGMAVSDISPVYDDAGDPSVQVKTQELRAALVAWCKQIDR